MDSGQSAALKIISHKRCTRATHPTHPKEDTDDRHDLWICNNRTVFHRASVRCADCGTSCSEDGIHYHNATYDAILQNWVNLMFNPLL